VLVPPPNKIGANELKTNKAKKTGKMMRREWTKADLKELKAHSKARTPVAKISKATRRTVGALRQKAFQLGLGLGHQR
jgi:NADH:ubiquinone oxidoreductase subunit